MRLELLDVTSRYGDGALRWRRGSYGTPGPKAELSLWGLLLARGLLVRRLYVQHALVQSFLVLGLAEAVQQAAAPKA